MMVNSALDGDHENAAQGALGLHSKREPDDVNLGLSRHQESGAPRSQYWKPISASL